MMKRIRIEDNLRRRIVEVYKEIRNIVKIRDKKFGKILDGERS